MPYTYPKQNQKDGEIACARAILEQREAINLDLFDLAKALRDECHQAIRDHDLKRYRKPPCTLTVKAEARKVGPKIIWITYTSSKITVHTGKSLRFTDEVRGRKNGRYEHHEDPEMRPYDEPISDERREELVVGAAAGVMRMHRYFLKQPPMPQHAGTHPTEAPQAVSAAAA